MLLLYALDVCRMLLLLVTQTHKCSGDRAINAPLGAAHLVAELRQLFLLAGEPAKVEVGHLHDPRHPVHALRTCAVGGDLHVRLLTRLLLDALAFDTSDVVCGPAPVLVTAAKVTRAISRPGHHREWGPVMRRGDSERVAICSMPACAASGYFLEHLSGK